MPESPNAIFKISRRSSTVTPSAIYFFVILRISSSVHVHRPPAVTLCDEKLYHWLRNNPPFYPFRMSLPWCAFLATDLCKAQRTTRCKTEPDSSKPLEKRTYGEPKGEDSFEGSWSRTCESRLIRMSQNGTEARLWHSTSCHDEWTYGLPVLRILLSV